MRHVAIASAFVLLVAVHAVAQTGTVRVGGDVPRPLSLTATDLAAMPRQTVTVSAREEQNRYEGVSVRELLTRAGVPSGRAVHGAELTRIVVVTAADGYRVVFALAELDPVYTDRVVLLADKKDGSPLPANAAPFQLIVPGEKHPARWVRQVVAVTVHQAPR